MARKIPVGVLVDPAVALAVSEGLVQVAELVLDPQVGDKCYTVTVCPGGPYEHSLVYESAAGAERAAGILRCLAWLAIEEYLKTQSTGPNVVVLGDQVLPAECHPDAPKQEPPTPDEIKQMVDQFHQRDLTSSRPVEQTSAEVHEGKTVGPDLFAGDLSAMGRLLVDIAAVMARHALRVQDLKQVARSAAEAIDEVVTDSKWKGGLSSHATELRQALARLEELEDR